MRAGVAVRAVLFPPTMRTSVAVFAALLQLPVRARVAVRAVVFHPAMRARVAHFAVCFLPTMPTPLVLAHRAPAAPPARRGMPPRSRPRRCRGFSAAPRTEKTCVAFSFDGSPSLRSLIQEKRLLGSSARAPPTPRRRIRRSFRRVGDFIDAVLSPEAHTSACRSPATTTRRVTRAFRPRAMRAPRGRTRGPGRFSNRPSETRSTTPGITRTRSRARRTPPLARRPR